MDVLQSKADRRRDPLGEFLVQHKTISEEDLNSALEQQKRSGVSLARILMDNGSVSRDDLNRAVAATRGIEFISLSPDDIDSAAAYLVPERVVQQYRAIPLRIDGGKLHVATTSPLNLAARDEISLLTGYEVVLVATTEKELAQAIQHHFSIKETTKQEIVDLRLSEIRNPPPQDTAVVPESVREGAGGAVVRLVNSIINGAIAAGASDIHLEPQVPEMRVRYRVDGILSDIMTIPRHVESALVSRVKIVADLDISERRRPQDGHISVQEDTKDYDLRVSTMPTVDGEKVVLRILAKDSAAVDLDRLGLSAEDRHVFESLVESPHGMILITGPTGSGKTTTLYTVLRGLNSATNNIVTIEDPVEYRLPGINQIQVNSDVGMTFANGLRTMLRQDPDIIMVGEIRDRETAELAVHAALTGHLVLSTLHTNDSAGAVIRLAELGVEPFLIASCVLGAIAQRLVRTICADCKEPYTPAEAELVGFDPGAVPDGLFHGRGCQFCYQAGYRGRTGVFEILRVTERMRTLITERQPSSLVKAVAIEEGTKSLLQRGLEKVREGITTMAEVRRVVGTEEA